MRKVLLTNVPAVSYQRQPETIKAHYHRVHNSSSDSEHSAVL